MLKFQYMKNKTIVGVALLSGLALVGCGRECDSHNGCGASDVAAVSNEVMVEANVCAMKGKKIVESIIAANLQRIMMGKASVWPHISEKDGLMVRSSRKDIASTRYLTSTQYFEDLFDIRNEPDGDNWRPYVDSYDPGVLAGGGRTPHSPGRLTSHNNAWAIAAGMTDQLGSFIPAMVSANVDVSSLIVSGHASTKGDHRLIPLNDDALPAMKGCAIVVYKNGMTKVFKKDELTVENVYGGNSFDIPDGVTLQYLEP